MPGLPKNPARVPPTLQRTAGVVQPMSGPGVAIIRQGDSIVAKISQTGVYKDADGNRFIGKEGDTLPEGWTYAGPIDPGDDVDPTAVTAEERAKGAAPENKMANTKVENRSA